MQADLDGSLLDQLDEYLDTEQLPDRPRDHGGPARAHAAPQAARRSQPNPETWGRTADARRGLSATLSQLPEAEVVES